MDLQSYALESGLCGCADGAGLGMPFLLNNLIKKNQRKFFNRMCREAHERPRPS